MKRYLVLVIFALAGCAPDIYDNPGATEGQFTQDTGYCKLAALNVPQAQARQLPPNYTATTTYEGTYRGNSNYGTLNGTSYTDVQAQPNAGQGLADLGTAIGNVGRQRAAFRACMESRGYTLRQ